MIFPKRGKFNVTDKGGLLTSATSISPWCARIWWWPACWPWGDRRHRPAIGHDYFGSDPNVIALNVGWGIYSLIFLLRRLPWRAKRGRCEKPFVSMSTFRW